MYPILIFAPRASEPPLQVKKLFLTWLILLRFKRRPRKSRTLKKILILILIFSAGWRWWVLVLMILRIILVFRLVLPVRVLLLVRVCPRLLSEKRASARARLIFGPRLISFLVAFKDRLLTLKLRFGRLLIRSSVLTKFRLIILVSFLKKPWKILSVTLPRVFKKLRNMVRLIKPPTVFLLVVVFQLRSRLLPVQFPVDEPRRGSAH